MDRLTVNGRAFYVVKLLGHGKGGYSYLCRGDDGCEYVVKKIHHEPCDYYTFGDKIASELNDYERLMSIGITMPKMLDVDKEQETILKEYIEGPTVYDMVKQDMDVLPCLRQVKEMTEKLYPAGTNIDYFPTNFVLMNNVLYYIDYECNNYMDEWNFENWGILYWSKTKEFLDYAIKHP